MQIYIFITKQTTSYNIYYVNLIKKRNYIVTTTTTIPNNIPINNQ